MQKFPDTRKIIREFQDAISQTGMVPPVTIESGKITRFSDNAEEKNKNGWCCFFLNPDGSAGGVFGSWREEWRQPWFYKNNSLSAVERQKLQEQIQEAQEKVRQEQEKTYQKAAVKVKKIWDQAQPANPDHGYLIRKQIKSYDLKQSESDRKLLIPVRTDQGRISSLQTITQDGDKKFFPGGRTKGCFFVIGERESTQGISKPEPDTVYICEGYATGATIHEATGKPVIVAFSSWNLLHVTKTAQKKYPESELVICADNDLGTQKKRGNNPGLKSAEKAAEATKTKICLCPVDSDFNDLMVSCGDHQEGLESVKKALTKINSVSPGSPSPSDNILSADSLSALKEKITAIPKETDKTKLPALLYPILKEMAGIDEAQADAILYDTIRKHFDFTKGRLNSYEKKLKHCRKEFIREQKETESKSKSLSQEELIEELELEKDSCTVHPAQDFIKGIMSFSVKVGNKYCLVTSDRKLLPFEKAESEGIILRHTAVSTARFSRTGILEFVKENPSISLAETYLKVHKYIKRFIYFHNKTQSSLVALWVMGTYLFTIFNYYPYIWLNAEKGSGKTLLMEILSEIAFNGELLINPTEAVIFRDVENNRLTMFIDEVEKLRKRDKDTYGSLISLLNSGFNNSGIVKRAEKTGKGGFMLKKYHAYSPKMFAGINEIDDVLQDRTILIRLLRKKDTDPVERYKRTDDILDLQKSLRDQLYMCALFYAGKIARRYQVPEDIVGVDHLSNRELDIWEPMFVLANIIDEETGTTELTDTLEAASKESVEQKRSDNIVLNNTCKLLSMVRLMLDEGPKPLWEEGDSKFFDTKEVLEYFKANFEDWAHENKTNNLTYSLKRIGITSKQKRIGGEKRRVYLIYISEFEDLYERYLPGIVPS